MNEVTKLYENAGVEKINIHQSEIDNGDPRFTGISHSDSYIKYPSFTAEKQIAILQTLIFSNKAFSLGKVYPHNIIQINNDKYVGKGETLGEALAKIVNKMWQDLTEEERKQIKEILE